MSIEIINNSTVESISNPVADIQVLTVQVPGITGPAGPQGVPGQANVLTIGTVTTGPAGGTAAATISGVSPNQVLNLTIPTGPQGVPGPANTLTIGTVTTVDAVTGGSATITGTSPNYTLNLTLPRGYGVIPGGSAGAVLVKNSATDYDMAWEAATDQNVGSTVVVRDSGGGFWGDRVYVAQAPTNPFDATRKDYVDAIGTSVNTPNSIVRRDSFGVTEFQSVSISTTPQPWNATRKDYVDAQDASMRRPVVNTQTANYTLVLTDERKIISMNSASAVTLTIPTNATVAFPVGTVIDVIQWGNGTVTIAGAAGVSLDYPDTGLSTRTQGSMIRLIKVLTDTWEVFGDTNNAIVNTVNAATSASTASTIVKRDASSRAQFADPSAAQDAATKNYVDTQDTAMRRISTNSQGATAYTFALTDEGKIVYYSTDNSAVTYTIPPNSSVAFAIGAWIEVWAGGSGVVTISPGAGVSLRGPDGTTSVTLRNTYSKVRIQKVNTDTWVVVGDVSNITTTAVASATSSPTAGNIVKRDSNGRAQVADPSATGDIATKNYVDTQDTAMRRWTVNAQTASYTLVLTDERKIVQMNVASANTLTVPPNSSVAFPVGSVLQVQQIGAGATTIAAGAGVTLNGPDSLTLRQYSTYELTKTATDTWSVMGSGNVSGSGGINNIVQMTSAAYTALGTKDANTLYVIVG